MHKWEAIPLAILLHVLPVFATFILTAQEIGPGCSFTELYVHAGDQMGVLLGPSSQRHAASIPLPCFPRQQSGVKKASFPPSFWGN